MKKTKILFWLFSFLIGVSPIYAESSVVADDVLTTFSEVYKIDFDAGGLPVESSMTRINEDAIPRLGIMFDKARTEIVVSGKYQDGHVMNIKEISMSEMFTNGQTKKGILDISWKGNDKSYRLILVHDNEGNMSCILNEGNADGSMSGGTGVLMIINKNQADVLEKCGEITGEEYRTLRDTLPKIKKNFAKFNKTLKKNNRK